MIKHISKIIYFFLKIINWIFNKIIKRDILVWIKFFIEQDAYKKVKLRTGKELIFFSPNFLIDVLIRDFHSKEPETLEWINNFKKKERNDLSKYYLSKKFSNIYNYYFTR